MRGKRTVALAAAVLMFITTAACHRAQPEPTETPVSTAGSEAASQSEPVTVPAAPETTAPTAPHTEETAGTEAPETSAGTETAESAEEDALPALDYGQPENWAYFELGPDREVDVFLICPTVDTKSETNSFDLNDKLKGRFVNALEMERGIYDETGRLFSPYYRQMSINAYTLPAEDYEKAKQIAYADISAAFRWYLDHESEGRGLILAGFSQGAEMCLELLKEFYGGEGEEAAALRERLITVYAIGWTVTQEMTEVYPQIVPASGERDTGTVVSFDCENGTLTGTIILPAGVTALAINPLNWKTDGTPADRSLNLGAVMATGAEPVPGLCGAYLGERGELIVTDVKTEDYPPVLDIFPEGAFHLYDYMFFFTNLKQNIADRTESWKTRSAGLSQ